MHELSVSDYRDFADRFAKTVGRRHFTLLPIHRRGYADALERAVPAIEKYTDLKEGYNFDVRGIELVEDYDEDKRLGFDTLRENDERERKHVLRTIDGINDLVNPKSTAIVLYDDTERTELTLALAKYAFHMNPNALKNADRVYTAVREDYIGGSHVCAVPLWNADVGYVGPIEVLKNNDTENAPYIKRLYKEMGPDSPVIRRMPNLDVKAGGHIHYDFQKRLWDTKEIKKLGKNDVLIQEFVGQETVLIRVNTETGDLVTVPHINRIKKLLMELEQDHFPIRNSSLPFPVVRRIGDHFMNHGILPSSCWQLDEILYAGRDHNDGIPI